jgi:hypothetical protein
MNETGAGGSSAGKSKLRQFLDYSGFAFGIVGIFLTVYTYYATRKERQPMYYVGQRAPEPTGVHLRP